jgi:hypothetical protein
MFPAGKSLIEQTAYGDIAASRYKSAYSLQKQKYIHSYECRNVPTSIGMGKTFWTGDVAEKESIGKIRKSE